MNDLKALCVDDEPNILNGYVRTLRKVINLDTAESGFAALEKIERYGPYAVIVSDMRMPQMDGVELLKEVKIRSPDTVRIMLTGNSDQETAIRAINDGDVFRFLSKPCEPKVLGKTILAGYRQHELIRAEQVLLGQTLTGAVSALGEVLSLINPAAFGRIARIRRYMVAVARQVGITCDWEMDVFPTLAHIGCVSLSNDLIEKIRRGHAVLSAEEQQLYAAYPALSARLIAKIPRLENVERAIVYQLKNFDGSGMPADDVKGHDIPVLARLFRLAIAVDGFVSPEQTLQMALPLLHERAACFDPELLAALEVCAGGATQRSERIHVRDLRIGAILARDVLGVDGVLLVAHGQAISETIRDRLLAFVKLQKIDEFVTVYAAPRDIG